MPKGGPAGLRRSRLKISPPGSRSIVAFGMQVLTVSTTTWPTYKKKKSSTAKITRQKQNETQHLPPLQQRQMRRGPQLLRQGARRQTGHDASLQRSPPIK